MPTRLFKNYFIDVPKRIIYRNELDYKKHLLWRVGGAVCFNKKFIENYINQVDWLGIKFQDGKKFYVSKKLFLDNCFEINDIEPQLALSGFFFLETGETKYCLYEYTHNLIN